MPDKSQAAAREIFGVRVGASPLHHDSQPVHLLQALHSQLPEAFFLSTFGVVFYLLSVQMAVAGWGPGLSGERHHSPGPAARCWDKALG